MTNYIQTWFLPDIPDGISTPASLEPVHNTFSPPYSIAFFCPYRGEIWGRRVVTAQPEGSTTKWTVIVQPHPEEKNDYNFIFPSGTVLNFLPTSVWPLIPNAVLQREFLLYMDWSEGLDRN